MDELRLQVVPAGEDAGGGFAVEIHVNGVEMTSAGAGLGMDPYDLLVPTNRLLPRSAPTQVPVARCGCGDYGCGETDVEITATDDVVEWTWLKQKPREAPCRFPRQPYVAEVRRAAADTSWETPERTAGRLVLERLVDGAPLPAGLRPDWLANDWRDATVFRVCLLLRNDHQIFLDFPWDGRSPQELADEVVAELTTTPPAAWSASWHAIAPGGGRPAIAGERWTQARIP